jgi:CheY-like chemotaxis protein
MGFVESGRNMKIYIIDDDRDIVESLAMVLESEGHEVGFQNDDVDASANIAAFGADLVILDVMFPENDTAGFEIAREIRNDEAVKDVPIIMLSAINEKGEYAVTFSNKDRDDAYLPVNVFVEKPIKPEELLAKIAELTA